MELKNFECQIAQAQVTRLLSGDALGQETLRQLNEHVDRCESCKSALDERKASLQAMLETRQAVVNAPEPPKALLSQAIVEKAREQFRRAQAETEPPTSSKQSYLKPLLLSIGLALVLIAMSFLAKNPTSLFGEKASTALESTTPPAREPDPAPAAAMPSTEPEPQDLEPVAVAAPSAEAQPPVAPAPEKTDAPVAPRSPEVKVTSSRAAKRPAERRPESQSTPSRPSGIRVYDSEGNAIK